MARIRPTTSRSGTLPLLPNGVSVLGNRSNLTATDTPAGLPYHDLTLTSLTRRPVLTRGPNQPGSGLRNLTRKASGSVHTGVRPGTGVRTRGRVGVRVGVRLHPDSQPDSPVGLTPQLTADLSRRAAAVTDPCMGVSPWGVYAYRRGGADG
jgi:hypothetical protein